VAILFAGVGYKAELQMTEITTLSLAATGQEQVSLLTIGGRILHRKMLL